MPDADRPFEAKPRLMLLLDVRVQSIRNRLRQALADAPVRLLATFALVVVIWLGLWGLFELVFTQIRRTPLEATVAIPLVFSYFFVAMLVLLTLSNALIAYGMLFSRQEVEYLLASPVRPGDIVGLKYIESLVMSSWSFFVLGLPLMFSIARQTNEPAFCPLFIAFFLLFIPIPGALGLLLAWLAARFLPRSMLRAVLGLAGVGAAVAFVWALRSLQAGDVATDVWLRSFFGKMSFVEAALLPNNWVARGIEHAKAGRLSEALCYLGVTFANALFLSWVIVGLVSRRYAKAFDRAASGRGRLERVASKGIGGPAAWVFFYLPRRLRLIAAKDLRTFFRDPLQWGQLAILFGLLVLYLPNVPTLHFRMAGTGWVLLIPFLNLCAISLILATFTCRFVFPLISLEGQKLWLVGLLPMPRSRLLLAKFAFSLTVTVLVAVSAMTLSVVKLEMEAPWAAIHLTVTASVCFALCGFAVGLGARFPMFHEPNVARIANGFGGTTNLLASVALVSVVLAGVGLATWWSRYAPTDAWPPPRALAAACGSVALCVGAGVTAMIAGARHFARAEL